MQTCVEESAASEQGTIALRDGKDPDQIQSILDGMYRKGLVFRYIKDESAKYGAVPFVEGVYEYQVKSMDRELARMFEDYVQEAFHNNLTETNPLLIHRPRPPFFYARHK